MGTAHPISLFSLAGSGGGVALSPSAWKTGDAATEHGQGWGHLPPIAGSPRRPQRSGVPLRAQGGPEVPPTPSWDFGRFVKQAGYFNYLQPPSPVKVISRLVGGTSGQVVKAGQMIYSPQSNPLNVQWGPLDDVIMGGRSASSFDASTGAWTGNVIVESGGFVGIRTRNLDPPLQMRCSGIRLKVRGQGQRLKFILRDDDKFNGVAWSYSFDTKPRGGLTDVRVSFSDFVPTLFARIVTPLPTLNLESITTFQFAYSRFEYEGDLNPKFQAGDFRLDVESIETF